jgi:O-antigen/teichoic acid export membrane protein
VKGEHYKNSFVLIFARGINVFVSFLLLPYMVRSLTVEEYGTYGQVVLIIEFFRAVVSMGLGSMIQLQYSRYPQARSDIFKTNAIASLVTGALFAAVVISLSPVTSIAFKNESLSIYLIIYAITLPLYLLREMFSATHIYIGKAKVVSVNELVLNLFRIALIVLSIQVFHSLHYVFVSLTLLNVLGVVLFFRGIPKEFTTAGKTNLTYWKEQITLGIPLGLTAVITTLILTSDSFMVSAMLSVEVFALYKAGALQVPFLSTLYMDIAAIIFPDVSRNVQERKYDEIVQLKSKSITFTALLIYPVSCFLLFYHRDFINVYLSEKYADSAIFFLVYNVALFIRVTNNRDILTAFGKTKLILNGTLIVAIINLLLIYVGIRVSGAVGAAVSTLISFYALSIVFNNASAKLLNVSLHDLFPIRKLALILLVSCIMAGTSYGLNLYTDAGVALKLTLITVFLGLSYVVLFRIGIVESSLVKGLLRRVPVLNAYIK